MKRDPSWAVCLRYGIPSYRLPRERLQWDIDAILSTGIEYKTDYDVDSEEAIKEINENYDAMYISVGSHNHKNLGIPGEYAKGVIPAVEMLRGIGDDAMPDFNGKSVVVIGGGNVAMDVAITARRLGAESVTLACLESEPEMPASREEIARAREEGIEIMPSYGVSKAIYEGSQVTGMELMRCTSVKDENGRFNPRYDREETLRVSADSILMAAGQKVDLSFLGDKYGLALERGLIQVDKDTQATSKSGIYAGGDATQDRPP